MSGNVCQYYDCRATRRKFKRRLFRFPYKNEKICNQWIINCGNVLLEGLPPEELRNRLICEAHFCDDDYKTLKKHHLKENAVPKKYFSDEEDTLIRVIPPTKTYVRKYSISLQSPEAVQKRLHREENSSTIEESRFLKRLISRPNNRVSPRENTLKKKIRHQASKLNKLQIRVAELKQKNQISKNILFHLMPLLSSVVQTFVFRGMKCKIWNKQEKQFSILFFYKSPVAYSFLRRGIALPSVSTIRRWMSTNIFTTGFDEGAKYHMKKKCASLKNKNKNAFFP